MEKTILLSVEEYNKLIIDSRKAGKMEALRELLILLERECRYRNGDGMRRESKMIVWFKDLVKQRIV